MNKHYNRAQSLELPIQPDENTDQLKGLLLSRHSHRNLSGKPVSIKQLSELLFYSAGVIYRHDETTTKSRPFPYAGKTSALEIYLWVRKGKEIQKGLYHYDPTTHSLEILLQPVTSKDSTNIWMRQKWVKKASVILFLTAVYRRTVDIYGPRGSIFPLIEAGHLMQNIYLLSPTLRLGCCAIGQFRDEALIHFLDLDPNEEYPIYQCVLESL